MYGFAHDRSASRLDVTKPTIAAADSVQEIKTLSSAALLKGLLGKMNAHVVLSEGDSRLPTRLRVIIWEAHALELPYGTSLL